MPSGEKLPESFFTALYADMEPDTPRLAIQSAADPSTDGRMSRMIEHWPGAVFCLDKNLHCQLINRQAREWCRHSDADGTWAQNALRVDEALWPALLDMLLPCLSAALDGRESGFDEQVLHPQRGLRRLSVQVQPDFNGLHVEGVFVHLRDLTESPTRAQASALPGPALSQRAQHLGQMAERLLDAAIFLLDPNGCIVDWPASAQRLLGHDSAQAMGLPVQAFDAPEIHGETPDTVLALERATFLGQYSSSGWRLRADGSRFWSELVLTALHDESHGELLGYTCLLHDMTEFKRLEDLLRQWNQELEVRVGERTSELHAINQDLEAFSYSVSHDLRAPLRHILSFVELLREDLGDPSGTSSDIQHHIETIAESAEHMGRLIEGLLAFSRLGRSPLQRREVSMGTLLQSSLNRVQHDPSLQRPDGEVIWQLPGSWPAVAGDATLLSLVWDNLLSNALKYSRRSFPAQISVDWHIDVEGRTVFKVSDNGVGFDTRRADRLFGVFQRLHRAKDFEGTGIGLAMCRRVVERHGGSIWAESRPGEGSQFCFALPAQDQAAAG